MRRASPANRQGPDDTGMNAPAPRVFISYRRDDASGHAGRIYDAVAARFGDANVFMDVEMKPGIDFVERITQVVGACRALLVVMGSEWASPRSGETESRLADPNDVVRLEVAAGLRRPDVSVIPLLVSGARMPDPDSLPEDLHALARVNALELSDLRWRYDVGRLMSALDEALARPGATAPAAAAAAPRVSSTVRRRAAIAAALALAVVGGVVVLLSSGDTHEPRAPSTATGDSVSLSVAKPGDTPPPEHVDIRNSAGEQPTLTFDGTAGERIAPDIRNVTAPGSITIRDPADETILNAWEFAKEKPTVLLTEKCGTDAGCQPVTLKRSGTHEVIISGNGDDTGSLDLRLYEVARDIRKKISPERPVRVELGVGQAAEVRFTSGGDDGQIPMRLRDIELDGFVNVRDPAKGLALEDTEFSADQGDQEFRVNVSRTGPYTIYLRPNAADPSGGAVQLELGPPQGK
jgi:TIR domain